MGRLLTVTRDAALVEEYQYGPNGTRTYEMNALRGIVGREFTYSDEDHLLTAKDLFTEAVTSYQYDVDGFLTEKALPQIRKMTLSPPTITPPGGNFCK